MLRKFLMTTVAATALAGSAYAADLPSRRAPPPAYIPPVSIFSVEYAFLNNWSVKLEYLFTDLGRTNNNNGFFFNNNNFRERNHIASAPA